MRTRISVGQRTRAVSLSLVFEQPRRRKRTHADLIGAAATTTAITTTPRCDSRTVARHVCTRACARETRKCMFVSRRARRVAAHIESKSAPRRD